MYELACVDDRREHQIPWKKLLMIVYYSAGAQKQNPGSLQEQ